ncbi:hypothetical protein [Streptomyces sp. NPDC060035]|uniref:hypothetical protein n=1 Tax=Streptomyces sp. NPDC060035 TaxID=3347044 RepID=UPI0036CCDF72
MSDGWSSRCRHPIGDRLEITGARQGLTAAEAVLELRVRTDDGDFQEHSHLAHERLSPAPGAERRRPGCRSGASMVSMSMCAVRAARHDPRQGNLQQLPQEEPHP